MKDLTKALQQQKENNLYRQIKTHQAQQAIYLTVNNQKILNFSSNDYLGLANNAAIKTAFQQGLELYGVGSGASHLICGHSNIHSQLEQALAEFLNRDRVLLFSTGYMANLGIISSLLTRKDSAILDKLNHASLIDGVKLSGAHLLRYPHLNLEKAQHCLQKAQGEKLLITDGVFSMDGDIAPLTELIKLTKTYDSWLMVDDAHGIGVLGTKGQGCTENFTQQEIPILVGTLGKAFGSFGAFIAGSQDLIEYIIQFARSYIYTTALPPALAYSTLQALTIIQRENWRRAKLQHLIQYFKQQSKGLLTLYPSDSPIQPILITSNEKALDISQKLYQQNIWLNAIRPPTVPSPRLRVTLSALHEEKHIDILLATLHTIVKA